jgi:hypothetical protein
MMQDVHVKLSTVLPEQKQLSTRKMLFTGKLDLNLVTKLAQFYVWNITLCGAQTWTLRKVDQE